MMRITFHLPQNVLKREPKFLEIAQSMQRLPGKVIKYFDAFFIGHNVVNRSGRIRQAIPCGGRQRKVETQAELVHSSQRVNNKA